MMTTMTCCLILAKPTHLHLSARNLSQLLSLHRSLLPSAHYPRSAGSQTSPATMMQIYRQRKSVNRSKSPLPDKAVLLRVHLPRRLRVRSPSSQAASKQIHTVAQICHLLFALTLSALLLVRRTSETSSAGKTAPCSFLRPCAVPHSRRPSGNLQSTCPSAALLRRQLGAEAISRPSSAR